MKALAFAAVATGREWHPLDNLHQFHQRIATCTPERGYSDELQTLPDSVLLEEGIHVLVLGRWTKEAESLVDRWQHAGILVLVFLIPESLADSGSLPEGNHFVEVQSLLDHESEVCYRPARAREGKA